MKFNQLISKAKKSLYLKNITTVVLGTGIAQFLPILLTPIITRLYLPRDYGEYALFISIVSIISLLVTAHYNNAIMLPQQAEEASSLACISFTINVLISCMVLFGSIIYSFISQNYIYLLISIPIFFLGMNAMLLIWNNRNKNYKTIAISRVLSGILLPLFQIVISFLIGGKGLILAYVISQFIVCVFLFTKTTDLRINVVKYKNNVPLLYRYKSFALYNLPSTMNNSFTVQLPTFLMTYFVGSIPTGNFNISNRLLGVPLHFLASSIGEVFKQSAVESIHKTGNCKRVFFRTFLFLSSLSLPVFIIIFFFVPRFFGLLFGTEWSDAGYYIQILCFLFFIRFVVSPLSYVLIATERLGEDLVIQIFKTILSAIGLICGYFIYGTPKGMLLFYVIGYSLSYIYEFYRSYIASK